MLDAVGCWAKLVSLSGGGGIEVDCCVYACGCMYGLSMRVSNSDYKRSKKEHWLRIVTLSREEICWGQGTTIERVRRLLICNTHESGFSTLCHRLYDLRHVYGVSMMPKSQVDSKNHSNFGLCT